MGQLDGRQQSRHVWHQLSQTGRLDWGKIGVSREKSVTVLITNTGNQPTGRLTITVNDDLFLMSPYIYKDLWQTIEIGSIMCGGTASFTVWAYCPDTWTVNYAKWYVSKVRVSGANGITAEFEIRYNWDYWLDR
ncbi:hypothetical protein AGMMS49940_10890 [Spirochaetia bacterium]|nr:hypothetical protein AGMMS49940_10890 [Spirochaetia bacterium]